MLDVILKMFPIWGFWTNKMEAAGKELEVGKRYQVVWNKRKQVHSGIYDQPVSRSR